jgi:uncharacterized membrane protein
MFRYGHHAGHPVLSILFLVLIAGLLAVGVIFLVRTWRGPGGRAARFRMASPPGPGFDPALAELRVRYARGEVTWDEYAQRAANLGHPIAPTGAPSAWPPGQGQPPPPGPPPPPPPG